VSSYTYVILTCSHSDEIGVHGGSVGEYGIPMLLPALEERGLPPFVESSKEITVYTMCGNYLPFADLVAAIEAVPWERPERVQLFHKHESADRYEEADLRLKRLVREFYMEWIPDENGQFDEFSQTRGEWRTRCDTRIEEPG